MVSLLSCVMSGLPGQKDSGKSSKQICVQQAIHRSVYNFSVCLLDYLQGYRSFGRYICCLGIELIWLKGMSAFWPTILMNPLVTNFRILPIRKKFTKQSLKCLTDNWIIKMIGKDNSWLPEKSLQGHLVLPIISGSEP